jgi:large subunit ribosomal protein LP0
MLLMLFSLFKVTSIKDSKNSTPKLNHCSTKQQNNINIDSSHNMPNKFTGKEKTRFMKNAVIASVLADLNKYNKAILVDCNQITSAHMQQIRRQMRDKAVIHMGKNTLLKKAFQKILKGKYETLLEQLLKENIGLIFSNESINDIRNLIEQNIEYTYAKAGERAPADIIITTGGRYVGQSNVVYFCGLNLEYNTTYGSIDILKKQILLKKGEKVTASHATVLRLFDIKPIICRMNIVQLYENGIFYDPSLLEVADVIPVTNTSQDEIARLAIFHSVASAFKDILAIAGETGVQVSSLSLV